MIQNFLTDPLVQNYLAPSYPIFIQIKTLLSSITNKKTMRSAKNDIINLVQKVGPEGERFLLQLLLDNIDLKQLRDKGQASTRVAFLTEQIKQYSFHPKFLSYFPQVIANLGQTNKSNELVSILLANMKIPLQNQLSIALSLYLSDRSSLSEFGEKELEKKLVELKQSGKDIEIPEKILEQLLFQISRNPELQLKLQSQFQYLLDHCEKIDKMPEAKIYNYIKGDWQYFASEQIVLQKPPLITIKKVDLLRDLGPTATLNIDSLKIILNQGIPMTQQDVFQCLQMISEQKAHIDTGIQKFITEIYISSKKNTKNQDIKKLYNLELTNKKSQTNWNIDNFITFCVQNVGNLRWQNVMNCFDRPKLQFTQQSFLNLMKYFEKAKKQGPKFKTPQTLYLKKWNNPVSQLNFLIQVFKCKQPEIFGLHEIGNRRIQKTVKDGLISKQIWGHLDLVQILIELSDYKYMQVRQLFDTPIMKYSDLLIQTLSEIKPSRGQPLLDELFSQLFPLYLHNHSNYIKLLQSLWQSNQDLVISTICQMYKNDAKKESTINLSRVLDIAQIIKESLIPLTNWNDYEFSVPLAILAGKRQFLHFEPWITDRIKNAGNSFLKAILGYIEVNLLEPIRQYRKLNQAFNYESILQKAQLSKQLLAFIFESIFLTSSSSKMSKRNFEKLKRIYKQVCQYYPEMSQAQMPDEIQQQAQRQFAKIYKKQITIEQAIQYMQKLKNSRKQEQTQQFASMITFMFSELRFHADYPEKELMITADLFAGVVNNNLIERKLLNVLLQVLQYDLKQDTCKYMFAVTVIRKIKEKLASEPQFCQKLIDNDLVLQKDPELVDELIKSIEPPLQSLSMEKQKKITQAIKLKNMPSQPIPIPVQQDIPIQSLKKVQFNDFDILTNLDKSKKIVFPEKDSKMSKINTLCNTLSISNVQEKAKDIINILDSQQAIKLIAYNIVFKRIPLAQGSNGTQVFYRLLERIPQIQKPILNITYKILQSWFSLKNKSINDKKLNYFKNLGYWLGRLTISKGIPVPMHKLNLRQILINSYQQTVRLQFNIPVVLKILEHINSYPNIFKPANPWLSKLLGTINQIESKLKQDHQNTKSEIKAFFKNTQMGQNFPPHSTKYLGQGQIEIPIIQQLHNFIKIHDDQYKHYMNQGIDLKMIITKAVDDSIQQIVEPVIDRAVKIALVTTKQLVMKDFAYENDSQKFKNSAYNVVKKLAGPLAQVTSRQPLKASMNRTLKTYLSTHITDATQIQNIISKAIPDNLDLGCALIKKAVIESAEQSIRKDNTINQSIQMRNQSRKTGQSFKDEQIINNIPAIVPEQLRPKPGGLSLEQFMVYDAFKRQKKISPQKLDNKSLPEKINEMILERFPPKDFRELILADSQYKDQLLVKANEGLTHIEEGEIQYCLQLCDMLKQFVEPEQAWSSFKEKVIDLTKKETISVIRKLVLSKYFPEKILVEIDSGNQQQNKAISLFERWLDTAHQEIQPFLQSLQEMFNKSQNQIKLFFQYTLSYALNKVMQSSTSSHSMDMTYIEDYSKLIIISLKLIASNNCILYLQHTTQAILQVFNRLQGSQSKVSYQRPFFKLFLNLICDATRKQYSFDSLKILTFYCVLAKAFHKINPMLCSNFAFAWVQLISNKYFLPTLLQKQQYWDIYYELISDLLKFAKQHLTEDNLTKNSYQVFYKGILRLIVILIHDFPDFLSQFSLLICLQTPDIFIQLRNMIISSYPRDMKFQKPQAITNRDNLQKEPLIQIYPKYFNLKFDTAKFNQFLSGDKQIKSKLQVQNQQSLQLFILYLGWGESVQQINSFRKFLIDLIVYNSDGELRDRLVKYILNLIRYPSKTTVFFIDAITGIIFSKQQSYDKVRLLLLNKILERMKVQGPHPWGMIYLINQFQMQKGQLTKLGLPKQILNQL